MTTRRLGAGLTIAGGLGLAATSLLSWDYGFEFAYFDRTTGSPATAGVFSQWGGPSAWSHRPGLAIALTLSGLALVAATLLATRARPALAARLRGAAVLFALVILGMALERLGARRGTEGVAFAALAASVAASGGLVWRASPGALARVLAASGAVLLATTFANWYVALPRGGWNMSASADLRDSVPPVNAWQVFSGTDLLLLAAAVALVWSALRPPVGRLVWPAILAVELAALAAVAWRLADPPGDRLLFAPGLGIGLAFAALSAGIAGTLLRLTQPARDVGR